MLSWVKKEKRKKKTCSGTSESFGRCAGSQASRHTAEPIKSADHLIWELLSRPRHEDEDEDFSLSHLEEWKRCQQGREVRVYRQKPNSFFLD